MWVVSLSTGKPVAGATVKIRDLKGKVRFEITGVSEGTYVVELFRTGYRVNDAYGTYLGLGSPSQISPAQVEAIKHANNGSPSSSEIVKIAGGRFAREFDLRENDVFLVTLTKM